MTKDWFRAQSGVVERITDDLRAHYPDLRVVIEDGVLYIRGSFPVEHDGNTLDRFQVELRFHDDLTRRLPTVRETDGRIPRLADRHVNAADGAACLCVDEDWLLSLSRAPTLLDFLDGPVRNYFIGQSLVESGKPWPFGERPHAKPGLLQAYGEWFETQDENVIRRYLDYVGREEPKGHWECPCGTGQRLRNCHMDKLRELRARIPRELAQRALARLQQMDSPSGQAANTSLRRKRAG